MAYKGGGGGTAKKNLSGRVQHGQASISNHGFGGGETGGELIGAKKIKGSKKGKK